MFIGQHTCFNVVPCFISLIMLSCVVGGLLGIGPAGRSSGETFLSLVPCWICWRRFALREALVALAFVLALRLAWFCSQKNFIFVIIKNFIKQPCPFSFAATAKRPTGGGGGGGGAFCEMVAKESDEFNCGVKPTASLCCFGTLCWLCCIWGGNVGIGGGGGGGGFSLFVWATWFSECVSRCCRWSCTLLFSIPFW